MFVQVIQGQVADRDQLHQAFDQWMRDVSPGAAGWLGTTAGVTDEGECVAVARFESQDAAQRNSERPEQHQWWTETSRLFTDGATFHDCPDAIAFLDEGPDRAGFVQVMEGEVRDPARARELMQGMEQVRQFRPEIIGGVDAVHSDGSHFTDIIYFTSEAEAREGEQKPPPPQLRETFQEQEQLYGDVHFYDLNEPWIYVPHA